MADKKTLERVERFTWVAIYGGMAAVILAFVSGGIHLAAGWSLGVMGGIAIAVGIVLIVVRSRMSETPAPGAQSESPEGNP
jgi:hypothetical protein